MAAEVGLAAYTDRLSGRPGDRIRFHVSSTAGIDGNGGGDGDGRDKGSKITARMVRCISADPNPSGPGRIEEDASAYFPPREFVGRRQEIHTGSYGRSREAIEVPVEAGSAAVDVWVFIVRRTHGEVDDEAAAAELQCVWLWGELGLYLNADDGSLRVVHGGSNILKSSERLAPNKWYHCTLTVGGAADASIGSVCRLTVTRLERLSKKEDPVMDEEGCVDLPSLIPMNARFELSAGGTFNGRLEDPHIAIGTEADETTDQSTRKTLIKWDTWQNMSEWTVPSTSDSAIEDNPLILHNHPARAVRGRRWDGTEMDWRHRPAHYGGIHFHDDDVYDFGWECDMEWEIPRGMPSGIYVVRLTDASGAEEALPLFVCSPLSTTGDEEGGQKKKHRRLTCDDE